MTTYHTQEVDCPCCQEKTEITILMSTNSFGKRTDFHSITMGFAPLPLQMSSCETCGFSGFTSDFLEPTLTDELKQKILKNIKPMVNQSPLRAGQRYEIYAKIRQMDGDSAWLLGNHYLHAAWAAVDEGTDDEMKYRHEAIKYFIEAFDKNQVPEDSESAITYLIGELYRRVGEIDSATSWFNKVVERAESNEAWSEIAQIAIQQRDEPKDEF